MKALLTRREAVAGSLATWVPGLRATLVSSADRNVGRLVHLESPRPDPGEQVLAQMVSSYDFFPSILDYLGIEDRNSRSTRGIMPTGTMESNS